MGAPRGNKNAAGKHKKLTATMAQNYNYNNSMRRNFNYLARKSSKSRYGELSTYAKKAIKTGQVWGKKLKKTQKLTGLSHKSIMKGIKKY
jgi:hypothetical protein